MKCECCQLILVAVRDPAEGGDTLGDDKHQEIFGFHFPQNFPLVTFEGRVKERQLQPQGGSIVKISN